MKFVWQAVRILNLTAADDEIIPPDQCATPRKAMWDLGFDHENRQIWRALHTGVMARHDSRVAVAVFLQGLVRELEPSTPW